MLALVLLGMGTLARATVIADLYGAGSYGTIASVAAAVTARAGGPVAAALVAGAVGYSTLMWGLAALAAVAAALAFGAESLAASA